ncbi:hypothetical protein [Paenibacillus sabinae]|uniref:Uncharacterized protein n=1 Tax=Paenibacillus sabinae T27 TaxID=1268072 RepID=X5A589_9BACL|nr:hypothetical protein [Paenibacillus sabinae]AHV98969.1 hypothetical protein PSAB_20390 [Paenibacillus sabinae T27]
MDQKITALIAAHLYDDAFYKTTGINPIINYSEVLQKHGEKILESLNKHLQDGLVLFDSSLQLIETIYKTFESDAKSNHENITFLVLSSKIFSLMLGMRSVLFSGSSDSYKCLLRPLLESFDTFYTSLINPDFSKEYGNTTEVYDNNDFWYRKGKGNKIRKYIHQLYRVLGADDEFVAEFDNRREYQQRFLSESLHSSFNAAFSTHFTFNLDGELKHMYGDVSIAYPALLLETIDEISNFGYILNALCQDDELLSLSFIQSFRENVLFNYYCDRFALLYQTYRPQLAELKENTNAIFRDMANELNNTSS